MASKLAPSYLPLDTFIYQRRSHKHGCSALTLLATLHCRSVYNVIVA